MKAKILTTTPIKQEWLDEIKEYIDIEFEVVKTKEKLQTWYNPNTNSFYAVWEYLRQLLNAPTGYRYRVYVMSEKERVAYNMTDHYAAYNVHDKDGVLDFYMSIGDRQRPTNGFKYNFARRFLHEVSHGEEQEIGRFYLGNPPDRVHDWEKEGKLKELIKEHQEMKKLTTKISLLKRILELTKVLNFLKKK